MSTLLRGITGKYCLETSILRIQEHGHYVIETIKATVAFLIVPGNFYAEARELYCGTNDRCNHMGWQFYVESPL